MTYCFLDTSVFVNPKFLGSEKIQRFFALAEEGYLWILIPKVTYREVQKKAHEVIKKELASMQKASKFLIANTKSYRSRIKDISEADALNEFDSLFEQLTSGVNVTILDYPQKSTETIFNSYFNEKPPFSSSKKSEFPDAFAIYSLEEWAAKKSVKVNLLSHDRDIKNYQSTNLIVNQSPEDFLDHINKEIERSHSNGRRLEIVEQLFRNNTQLIEEHVRKWFRAEIELLGNIDTHYNVGRLLVKVFDYKILSVFKKVIDIEIKAAVKYKLTVEYEDVFEMRFNTFHTYSVEDQIQIPLTAKITMQNKIGLDREFAIVEINNGNSLDI